MSAKRFAIGKHPIVDANAEHWIRQGEESLQAKAGRLVFNTARLTIDVTPLLRPHQGRRV